MDATESADLYAATRARVTETAKALTAEQLNTRVPACPDWTVHNLISHLAGVAGDDAVDHHARQDLPTRFGRADRRGPSGGLRALPRHLRPPESQPDRVLAVACRRAFLVGRRIPPPAAP
ncbi:maleylpyruvate isomerase N-terminal domain-containing protein [Kribbella qitaiheensis]|uniref:maleylpyruvate isomerase N-terminal domain-containing protein n=1 Tax=Kribbella qitaiheensis TaxID=1544730 RepID=UPI00360DBC56